MASSNCNQGLELTATQAEAVQNALQYWLESNLVSASQVGDLSATVQVMGESWIFYWGKFAKYTGRLCLLPLVLVIVFYILAAIQMIRISLIFLFPTYERVAVTSALAVAVQVWGYHRSLSTPQQFHLNGAIHVLGALLFFLAVAQVPSSPRPDQRRNRHLIYGMFLLLPVAYGVNGILVQSNLI
ncbi:hypothetical protein F4825DRAFT_266057 [Nemania diffusa]|nr:hypothetical protein F4825DRAFT_266057 [Nemania diffusa]